MPTITVPKEVFKNQKLVAIPRTAYREFLNWQKRVKSVRTFRPTAKELQALACSRKDFQKGDYVEWKDLRYELEHLRSRKSKKKT